jgi:hypothetical protein
VPANGSYLGAWVNPSGQKAGQAPGGPAAYIAGQLSGFGAAVGHRPALVHVYTAFARPVPVKALQAVSAAGATPLLDWNCTDTAQVASGADDAHITAYARSLKAYGSPVLLRWFWEMNLPIRKDLTCLGSGGPSTYVAAWRHIWTLFQQVGVPNVAFVWCPGISAGVASMAPFYPGASYVDWIGVDGYVVRGAGAGAFTRLFGPWYAAYAGQGKPLMLAETGAMAGQQAPYLQDIGATWPAQYPAMKALVYYDAPGPRGDWSLDAAGQQAYGALADSAYFSVPGDQAAPAA